MNSTAFPVTIGIDEIATETQECDGFAFFCLPDALLPQFNADAAAILRRHPDIHAFHGKKYKVAHEAGYREFLTLIRNNTARSLQAGASNILFAKVTMRDLKNLTDSVLTKAFNESGVPLEPAISVLRPYAHRMLVLARELSELGPGIMARVHIDEGEELKSLSIVSHNVGTTPIRISLLLKAVYNGYAGSRYVKAPQLGDDSVVVMRDSKSFLIQAADVLGNFSMNHVFAKLGMKSKSKEAKGRLIEEVYGDIIDRFDFSGKLSLRGNDLFLAPDRASLRFRMQWDEVKVPSVPEDGGTNGSD